MGFTRREFLVALGAVGAGFVDLPKAAWAEKPKLARETRSALHASRLVYVSPLMRDGSESHCHAEMWFVAEGEGLLAITSCAGWRARALRRGLTRARIWIGEYGTWIDSGGKFRGGPTFDAFGRADANVTSHERALAAFATKYGADWKHWGPRYKAGLEDGSRVLIRYSATDPPG